MSAAGLVRRGAKVGGLPGQRLTSPPCNLNVGCRSSAPWRAALQKQEARIPSIQGRHWFSEAWKSVVRFIKKIQERARKRELNRATTLVFGKNPLLEKPAVAQDVDEFLGLLKPVAIKDLMIRIGAEHDGGYVIPDLLDGVACCFSPGVGRMSEFELGLAKRSIKVFMADNSVEKPSIDNLLFHFEKKHLGLINDERHTRLADWVARNASDQSGDLILQMDIEGSEYGVLLDASEELLCRFRIIAIEFHSFDMVIKQNGLLILKTLFHKILRHFTIVHIHPNNYVSSVAFGDKEIFPVLEFVFLRNDFVTKADHALQFPHPLDRPNKRRRPDAVLPRYWW
jgi:hypothetical protein